MQQYVTGTHGKTESHSGFPVLGSIVCEHLLKWMKALQNRFLCKITGIPSLAIKRILINTGDHD